MKQIKFRLIFDTRIVGYERWQECQWWYSKDQLHWTPGIFDLAVTDKYQFSGLFDKNGKEIYEGDILKSITRNKIFKMPPGSSKDFEWSQWHESIFEVYTEPGMWLVRFASDKTYHTHLVTAIAATKDSEGSIEIIGNIWENQSSDSKTTASA